MKLKHFLETQDIFVQNLYKLLVENFPHTYFVGGAVRDACLHKKTLDIDMATSARPEQILALLKKSGINFSVAGMQFGVVKVVYDNFHIEIASFRTEKYHLSRYPAILYNFSPKIDAKRRDFTINALYLQAITCQVHDYHSGLEDIKKRRLAFIGNATKRIHEDPLRIIRAMRFCLQLNFRMDLKTWQAVTENFSLTAHLSRKKREAEIFKIQKIKIQNLLKEIVFGEKPLDKVSKKFYYDFK